MDKPDQSQGGLRKLSLNNRKFFPHSPAAEASSLMGQPGGLTIQRGTPGGGMATNSQFGQADSANLQRPMAERTSEYNAPLSMRQSIDETSDRKLPGLLYKGVEPSAQMTPVRNEWAQQPPHQPFMHQQQHQQPPLLSQNNLDTLNSRQPPLAPANPGGSHFGGPANSHASGALSTSGMSHYQNPLMNQSIGTGAMSQHTGYGAISQNMHSHHPRQQSPGRSEAGFSQVGVQNPLLTMKPGAAPSRQGRSEAQFQFAKTLFENPISIRICCQDREDYVTNLTLKMIIHAPSNSSQQLQVLTVELTDEEDPFFIFTMDCSEQDYHILKNEQQIMVDFQQFPNQFVELLQYCQRQSQEQTSAFVCVLELGMAGEAVFKIVQTNQFKASDHLRLKFRKGTDETIKKYLAGKLKEYKDKAHEFSEKSSSFEGAFVQLKETNEQLMFDIKELREENRRVVDQVKIEEQNKLHEVQQKMLLEQKEILARNEADKKDSSERNDSRVKDLTEKLGEQQEQITQLLNEKRDLETEAKERSQQIAQQQHELEIIRGQIKELRETNKGLDSTRFVQEKSINEYSLKQENLLQQLEGKNQSIAELKSHLQTLQDSKDKQDEDVKSQKELIAKLQKKIEFCKDQMEKGNEHIQTLEDKKSNYKKQILSLKQANHQNTSNKDSLIKKQEEQLQAKATEINGKLSEIRELNLDKQKLSNDLEEARNLNNALRSKLETSVESLEKNKQLIHYLNSQLNSKQSSTTNSLFTGGSASFKPPVPTSTLPQASSSSAFKPSISSVDQMGENKSRVFKSPARSNSGLNSSALAGASQMSSAANNLLASASSHHTQFSAQTVENPLKTMNTKPEADSISQQSLSVGLGAQMNQMKIEPSSVAAKEDAPQPLSFQPVSKYTRQLMEQQSSGGYSNYKNDLPTKLQSTTTPSAIPTTAPSGAFSYMSKGGAYMSLKDTIAQREIPQASTALQQQVEPSETDSIVHNTSVQQESRYEPEQPSVHRDEDALSSKAPSNIHSDAISVSQVSMSEASERRDFQRQNESAPRFDQMSTSFGQLPMGGMGGGLRLHQGNQIPSQTVPADAMSESIVSKSEQQNFKMDATNETLQEYLAGGSKPTNDTKLSENEAFMAYMSKAEVGEEDDDDL